MKIKRSERKEIRKGCTEKFEGRDRCILLHPHPDRAHQSVAPDQPGHYHYWLS